MLESCFGKLKGLEGVQSRSGFTGLVLSLGAMVSRWTGPEVAEGLERCRVRDVIRLVPEGDRCDRAIATQAGLRPAHAKDPG